MAYTSLFKSVPLFGCSVKEVRRRFFIPAVFFLALVQVGLSHFGGVNPYPLGLLSGVGVVCINSGLILMCAMYFQRLFYLYLAAGAVLFPVVVAGCWWYFQFYQVYFDFSVLRFGEDVLESINSLAAFSYWGAAATYSGLCIVISVLVALLHPGLDFSTCRKRKVILMLGVFFVGVMSISIVNSAMDTKKQQNTFRLRPSFFHPIQAFFSPEFDDVNITISEFDSASFFRKKNTPRTVMAGKVFPSGELNVIVLVLESAKASMWSHYGNKNVKTPVFDRLASKYGAAPNFYANTNSTVKAETAIVCGIFDHNSKLPYSKYDDKTINFSCLPHLLKAKGYQSSYFHGYKGRFYERSAYMKKIGFDNAFFYDDLYTLDESQRMGWGVPDHIFLPWVLDLLEEQSTKFFSVATTLTPHYPFDWGWDLGEGHKARHEVDHVQLSMQEVFDNYSKAIEYEDFALGVFWEKFEKSSLFNNTVVIITSDHGVWSFDENITYSLAELNEDFFKAPLIIYHPEYAVPLDIEQVSSQIDIPSTIAGMLFGDEFSKQFIGKNMLNPVVDPWVILMKSGEIIVLTSEQVCYLDELTCDVLYQNCSLENYVDVLDVFEDHRACYSKQKTDFGISSGIKKTDSIDLYNMGYDLIRLQNKVVFSPN